jgi:hypothetical protein
MFVFKNNNGYLALDHDPNYGLQKLLMSAIVAINYISGGSGLLGS